MLLREFFEAATNEVSIIFGRFNPPHKGHKAAWEMAAKSPKWYVGTQSTVGPKDPLPYDVKIKAMAAVWPEVAKHIVAETSWLTLASMIYEKHGDAVVYILTDEEWVTKTLLQYNGKEGPHGFYQFSKMEQRPTPRLSSATALRDAVMKGDRDAFADAAGVSADLKVAGKPFFDLVAEYLLPYANAPAKTKKTKETYDIAAKRSATGTNEVAKVKLSTDPEFFGADVRDSGKEEKTVMLPVKKLHVFEPDDKFDDPKHAKNLENIIKAIKAGKKLPPILVRRHGVDRYQVLDGHHRFKAYRMIGAKEIPARIVDPKNVSGDTTEDTDITMAEARKSAWEKMTKPFKGTSKDLDKSDERAKAAIAGLKKAGTDYQAIVDKDKKISEISSKTLKSFASKMIAKHPDSTKFVNQINKNKHKALDLAMDKLMPGSAIKKPKVPATQEDAAGVGIITKQNTTADVGPGTIKKNLKAYKL
jgi:hypothetical protein